MSEDNNENDNGGPAMDNEGDSAEEFLKQRPEPFENLNVISS